MHSPAARAAVIIAVLVTTLTGFLVAELCTEDGVAALVFIILFALAVMGALNAAVSNSKKEG